MWINAEFPISRHRAFPLALLLVGVLVMCGKQPYGGGAPRATQVDSIFGTTSDTTSGRSRMDTAVSDTNQKDIPLGVPVQPESYRGLKEEAKQPDRTQEKNKSNH